MKQKLLILSFSNFCLGASGKSPKCPPNTQKTVTFGGLGVWGAFFGGGVSEAIPNEKSPKHPPNTNFNDFTKIFLTAAAMSS